MMDFGALILVAVTLAGMHIKYVSADETVIFKS